jgi:tetratricopeptide (TPR) repeat protein
MLGLSDRQLKAWEQQGFVTPVMPGGGDRDSSEGVYTFSDLVSLRTLQQLRKEGVGPARIRSLHAALKKKLAGVERPWSELQVHKRGKQLLVHFQGAPLEPLTGQLLLEYASKDEASRVRKLEKAPPPGQREMDGKIQADRFFRAGLRYEEQKETLPKAIRAYQKAIELDAHAAGAWINLGTVFYNLGKLDEAERCYRAVLAFDEKHALAHFNLANVFDERRHWDKARRHYEEAIRLSPNSPDPHYNLALVYDKLGLHGRARRQWVEYLKHDPHSQWAGFARQQLAKTAWRLVARPEASPAPDSPGTEKTV